MKAVNSRGIPDSCVHPISDPESPTSMRILCGFTLLAAAVSAALPTAAQGQSVPSPYRYIERGQEASLFTGWFSADRGRFGFGPGEAALFGGRYGVELTGPLALEGVLSFLPTTRDVVHPGRVEGDRVVGEADVKLVIFDARLRFTLTGRRTWHGISPHVLLGGGIAMDVEGDQREDLFIEEPDRFDFGTRFTGVFGAGARYFLAERWVVRSDAYVTLYQLGVPPGYSDPDRSFENVAEKEWVNAGALTVGVSWLF